VELRVLIEILRGSHEAAATSQRKELEVLKSTSASLILTGVSAIIFGALAVAWPGVTILALVILFAVYAFIGGGLQATRAFSSAKAGPVLGHLLLGLVDVAAGVVAVVWPAPTALVLVLVVGSGRSPLASPRFSPPSKPGRPRAPARRSYWPDWCRSRSAWCCSRAPGSARSLLPCFSDCSP
jgi:hypothetical protein